MQESPTNGKPWGGEAAKIIRPSSNSGFETQVLAEEKKKVTLPRHSIWKACKVCIQPVTCAVLSLDIPRLHVKLWMAKI